MKYGGILALGLLLACARPTDGGPEVAKLDVTSPAYKEGGMIPPRFTADGENRPPAYSISGIPDGCRSIAWIMEDPDAPAGTWVHWVVWNLPAETAVIPAGGRLPGEAREGLNSWGDTGYGGPSPPSGVHRYVLEVWALDTTLDLPASTGAEKLRNAISGHVLARGRLMGRYGR